MVLPFDCKEHFHPKDSRVRDFGPDFNLMWAFLNGLNTVCARQTEADLGDRSTYVGASDVNSKCIRRIVLEKRDAQSSRKIDLQQGIYYERGHLAEHILRKALIAERIPHYYQSELIHPTALWLVAHPDFMFIGPQYILVHDMKTGRIPLGPDYWVRQLHLQMGLVKMYFPDKTVLGSVTAIDLTEGAVKQFKGFFYDSREYAKSFKKARFIKYIMENGGEDRFTTQTPLCAWCRYMADCPEYRAGAIPEIKDPEAIAAYREYEMVATAHTQNKKSYDTLRNKLLNLVLGYRDVSDRVKIDGVILKPVSCCRTTVDGKRLKVEKPDIYAEYSAANTYYKLSCTQVLDVSPECSLIPKPNALGR